MVTFRRDDLDTLLNALWTRGYRVIGPTVRNHAIVHDTVRSSHDLPEGRSDEQQPATYRLRSRDDRAVFAYAVGPVSWKQFLFPPRQTLFRVRRTADGPSKSDDVVFDPAGPPTETERLAFLGVRPCDLAALDILDRVYGRGAYRDPGYVALRETSVVIVVNCTHAASTCFCRSLGTGPGASTGGDLHLTEVVDAGRHYFTARPLTARGEEILGAVPSEPSTPAEIEAATAVVESAARAQWRSIVVEGLHDALVGLPDHPRWQAVSERCLTCGNCTMVCPTCFCTTVEDVTDLAGTTAERHRRWDSCFTLEHSYIHGGSVRPSASSRYRQWLTHKLATWTDQFGTIGCVGCGRCIAWCPVGIDITEEATALQETAHSDHARHREHNDAKPQVHSA